MARREISRDGKILPNRGDVAEDGDRRQAGAADVLVEEEAADYFTGGVVETRHSHQIPVSAK